MKTSDPMLVLGLEMTCLRTSKRVINITSINVVKGMELGVLETEEEQERFYKGFEMEWERTPRGNERFEWSM